MKKVLALITVLVMCLSITACNTNTKSVATKEFDYGGIVIDIPEDFEVADVDDYSIEGRSIVQLKDDDNIISIMYWLGNWEPDDSVNFSSTDADLIYNDSYKIDGNYAEYLHCKENHDGNTVYQQSLSIFLDDRWVVVQSLSYNKETDIVVEQSIRNVRISDNQYEFYGFEENSDSQPSIKLPIESEIIDVNELPSPTPEPTPEPTQNPYLYEYYEYGGVSVPIPVGFKYDMELSTTQTEIFFSEYNEAQFSVSVYEVWKDINSVLPSHFQPNAADDNGAYTQDYFTVIGNTAKSHIKYNFQGEPHEDFDILISFNDRTIVISMSGPESYSEIFRHSFDQFD